MAIQQVTDRNFNEVIKQEDKLVVVDFYADWCAPCRMLSPILNELNDEFGNKITIAKVNVDQNPVATRQNQVMSIPTLKFYKDGKLSGTIQGLQSKSQLSNIITNLLK